MNKTPNYAKVTVTIEYTDYAGDQIGAFTVTESVPLGGNPRFREGELVDVLKTASTRAQVVALASEGRS